MKTFNIIITVCLILLTVFAMRVVALWKAQTDFNDGVNAYMEVQTKFNIKVVDTLDILAK